MSGVNQHIINRFLNGELSLEDKKLLEENPDWLEELQQYQEIFEADFGGGYPFEEMTDDAHAWRMVKSKTTDKLESKKVSLKPIYWSVAASILLLFSWWGYTALNSVEDPNYIQASQFGPETLIDGSKVWQLDESKGFPTVKETSTKRKFILGDANEFYLDVNPGAKVFEIETNNGIVRVLGTNFLTKLNQGNLNEIVLWKGKLQILQGENQVILDDGMKALFTENGVEVSPFNPADGPKWSTALLSFEDQKVEDIIIALEKQYQIKINSPKTLNQERLNISFSQIFGADAVALLCKTLQISFSQNKNNFQLEL